MTRSYTCPPTSARHVIAKSVDITVISRFANSVIDAHVRAAKLSASKLAHATRTPTEDLVSWRTRELTMSSARLPATAAGHARTNSACRPAVAAPFTTGHVSGEDEGSRRRSLLRPSPRATCHARTREAAARRCCALHRGPCVTRGRSPLSARRCRALHHPPRVTRGRSKLSPVVAAPFTAGHVSREDGAHCQPVVAAPFTAGHVPRDDAAAFQPVVAAPFTTEQVSRRRSPLPGRRSGAPDFTSRATGRTQRAAGHPQCGPRTRGPTKPAPTRRAAPPGRW